MPATGSTALPRPWLQRVLARSPIARRLVWPRTNQESAFVHTYLDGLTGIEIGASAHNDYGIPAVNVDSYSDMDSKYKQAEFDLCGRKRAVDVVAPGDDLPFADDEYEFVFASHVVEHFPDPVRALREWRRVACRYVVVVVPHRDRTFDSDRELTSTDELAKRNAQGFTSEEDKHWTVWNAESFGAMCDRFDLHAVDWQDPDDKVGNGFTFVLDASA